MVLRNEKKKKMELKEESYKIYLSRFVISPYLGNLEHFSGLSHEGEKNLTEAWKDGRLNGICVGKGGGEAFKSREKKHY